MRKLFTFLAAMLIMATGWTQSPQKMTYQAVVRDATNHLVTTQIGMQISILQSTSTGTAVYIETQTPTPNSNGLVTIEINGALSTVSFGTFSAIDWSAGPYFIKTEIATAVPLTTYTITGTSQILSVPYALYAKTVAGIDGKVSAGTNITITGLGTSVSPYVVNAAGGSGIAHYVGELYGGGIVVSVWKTSGVEHGLIASLVDMSAGVVAWSDVTSTQIGLTAESQINGQTNTTAIVAQQTSTSAAQLCKSFNGGGFSDWYLPAIWELNECYKAALVVNNILGGVDGFRFDYYWSSTEASASEAYYLGFHTNIFASNAQKSNVAGRVRAIRQF